MVEVIQIFETDDGRLMTYQKTDDSFKFFLDNKPITFETAFRHFINEGVVEPFSTIMLRKIDSLCEIFETD